MSDTATYHVDYDENGNVRVGEVPGMGTPGAPPDLSCSSGATLAQAARDAGVSETLDQFQNR